MIAIDDGRNGDGLQPEEDGASEDLITPQQWKAIELLAAGTPVCEVAGQIEVHRSTLWRWRTEDVEFQKRYRLTLMDQRAAYQQCRVELIRRAVETLMNRLETGEDGGLALRFLEKAGVFTPPEVDPEPDLIPRLEPQQKTFSTWAEAAWAEEVQRRKEEKEARRAAKEEQDRGKSKD